jgi:glycosyltransferase involved in cell wall biosynthesis
MCSGAVVVTSRIGVLPAALGDGLIDFDPYSTEDLGRALRRALALSPAEASSYREACRSRAEAFLRDAAARPPLPGLSRAAGIGEPCASRS